MACLSGCLSFPLVGNQRRGGGRCVRFTRDQALGACSLSPSTSVGLPHGYSQA